MNNLARLEILESLIETSDFRSAEAVRSIVTLAQSIDDEEDRDLALLMIAKSLAAVQEWNNAGMVTRLIKNPLERAEALHEIAIQFTSMGQMEKAISFLDEAVEVAKQIEEPWQQAERLCRIAKTLAAAKANEKAIRMWQEATLVAQRGEENTDSQSRVDCSGVLREITTELALFGEVGKAKEIAQNIRSTGKRDDALKAVMNAMKRK